MLRTIGWFLHELTAQRPWVSWIIHGLTALPLVWIVARWPWTAPGLVFAYREAEQVWFRYLNEEEFAWVDHVMDVLVPGCVGWLLLR